jgi:predicted RecA/RadA family phage recombinase
MPKSTIYQEDRTIRDYTPASDTEAGAIVESGGLAGQVTSDLTAGQKGAIRIAGIIKVNKTHPAITHPVNVYWDKDGTDVDGSTGGAATATLSEGDFFMGATCGTAGTNVATVEVDLNVRVPISVLDLNAGTDGGTMTAAGTAYDETIFENNQEVILGVLRKTGLIGI